MGAFLTRTKNEPENIDMKLKIAELKLKEKELNLKEQEILSKKADYERYLAESNYVSSTLDLILLSKRLDILQSLCSLANTSNIEPTFDDLITMLELFDHNTNQFNNLRSVYNTNIKKKKDSMSKMYS